MSTLLEAVCSRVRLPDGPCVIALSGGPDSAVLAWIVASAGTEVRAVHVDHGFDASPSLRGAAADIAEMLGIQLDVVEVTVAGGPSPEDAARIARYRGLQDSLKPEETLLTGHTRSDQAETVLGNLLRGAGLDGLSGIPERRGSIVRPLLAVSRSETRELAALLRLPSIEDPSNLDMSVRRNRLRHETMPALSTFNPSLEETLARTARVLRDDKEFIEEAATGIPLRVFGSTVTLPAACLSTVPVAVAARTIRTALRAAAGPYPGDSRDVHLVLDVAAGVSKAATLAGGILVRRDRAVIVISPAGIEEVDDLFAWSPPASIRWSGWAIESSIETTPPVAFPTGAYIEVFDADQTPDTLEVRAAARADLITFRNGHKLIVEALAEAGVPAWRRSQWPVVVADGRVLWVPGVRRADTGWIDTATTRYLWVRATHLEDE